MLLRVYFALSAHAFSLIYKKKKMLPRQMSGSFLFMFSSRSFIVSDLIFKALINVKLMFCELCNIVIQVILLLDIHFFQHHFLKRDSLFWWVSLAPLSSIS